METVWIIIAVVFILVFVVFPLAGFIMALFFSNDSKKEESNSKAGMQILLCVILAVVAIAIFGLLGRCSDGDNWQPRHTQNVKPAQINVNTIIFSA